MPLYSGRSGVSGTPHHPHGLKTNLRLVSAVANFPQTQNLTELRQFLGMCSYHRSFVPDFSKIASPLQQLTHKDILFQWTTDCEESFQSLKKELTSTPALSYPFLHKSFVFETDASIEGLGAILSQPQHDALMRTVAYASRSLTAVETNYSYSWRRSLWCGESLTLSPTSMAVMSPFSLTILL